MGEQVPTGAGSGISCGRAIVTATRDGLVIDAPGPGDPALPVSAVAFGVPWLVAVIVASVWYLGWGIPDPFLVRLLLWAVGIVLTHNLHTLAVISIWNAVYARVGTERLTIDPELVTVVRKAGRVPREVCIRRGIMESAVLLPEQDVGTARPRIEIRSWRSAVRFGGGLNGSEAEECARLLATFFDEAEASRNAANAARDARAARDADVTHYIEARRLEARAGEEEPIDNADPPCEGGRTSVMQAYREALEASKGPVRRRLSSAGSSVRSKAGRLRRRS